VFLHVDGSGHTLPARGAAVSVDGRDIGFVTSVARHFEDGPIALALVKRNVAVDATLTVEGLAAAQEVIVTP
jgi:folate-binding Fe-S cluster repair protein YgfZ